VVFLSYFENVLLLIYERLNFLLPVVILVDLLLKLHIWTSSELCRRFFILSSVTQTWTLETAEDIDWFLWLIMLLVIDVLLFDILCLRQRFIMGIALEWLLMNVLLISFSTILILFVRLNLFQMSIILTWFHTSLEWFLLSSLKWLRTCLSYWRQIKMKSWCGRLLNRLCKQTWHELLKLNILILLFEDLSKIVLVNWDLV
jgi:hypothetical protein